MQFSIQREDLLKPLQLVAGVVERKQTMPVLSNVLLVIDGQNLSITGTDTEVELIGRTTLEDSAMDGNHPARTQADGYLQKPAGRVHDPLQPGRAKNADQLRA